MATATVKSIKNVTASDLSSRPHLPMHTPPESLVHRYPSGSLFPHSDFITECGRGAGSCVMTTETGQRRRKKDKPVIKVIKGAELLSGVFALGKCSEKLEASDKLSKSSLPPSKYTGYGS